MRIYLTISVLEVAHCFVLVHESKSYCISNHKWSNSVSKRLQLPVSWKVFVYKLDIREKEGDCFPEYKSYFTAGLMHDSLLRPCLLMLIVCLIYQQRLITSTRHVSPCNLHPWWVVWTVVVDVTDCKTRTKRHLQSVIQQPCNVTALMPPASSLTEAAWRTLYKKIAKFRLFTSPLVSLLSLLSLCTAVWRWGSMTGCSFIWCGSSYKNQPICSSLLLKWDISNTPYVHSIEMIVRES
jgi:hypothetical protein